ncbi:MAG: hypothetical protein KGH96_23385 [Sphingomonadales bacterium]|nr:hypothetical protein [Sphingomonadales bacterium]
MAIHTDLPIYRTGVRLLALAVKVQEQMPRSIKRILGEKITQHCVVISLTSSLRRRESA